MVVFGYKNFWILLVLKMCTSASITNEDIEQILGPRTGAVGKDGFPSLTDLDALKLRISALSGLQDGRQETDDLFQTRNTNDADGLVSKRPFCNGFTGCGRLTGKRAASSFPSQTLSQVSNTVQATPKMSKRPFCNGFFGCGNPGKRLVFRRPMSIRFLTNEGRAERKRVLCNPVSGCGSGDKRSPYRVWLERMRSAGAQ